MAQKKTPALACALNGRWRIAAMDLWDKDAIDPAVTSSTAC